LASQIRQLVPTGKVNVIAHSMGGLDTRYLISRGSGRDMIQTLITLGTPFRGTLVADIAADPRNLSRLSPTKMLASLKTFVRATALRWPSTVAPDTHFAIVELSQAISRMSNGDYSGLAAYFSKIFTLHDAALQELTTDKCDRLFPADCSDFAGVTSYSCAGSLSPAEVGPLLLIPALALGVAGEANDGVVPLNSAKLPSHLATSSCDHLGLIGWSPRDVSECYRQICQILLTQ
jgi:pimeloyl-ACP methyl ester carboxylesterase